MSKDKNQTTPADKAPKENTAPPAEDQNPPVEDKEKGKNEKYDRTKAPGQEGYKPAVKTETGDDSETNTPKKVLIPKPNAMKNRISDFKKNQERKRKRLTQKRPKKYPGVPDSESKSVQDSSQAYLKRQAKKRKK